MSNIDYTLWPNANGNLGEIKVQIPDGVTTTWPEGDALVGNFVYNKGKLAGFVDTKALVANESKSTTFPYDYVNITVDGSLEGVMSFNPGDRTKYFTISYTTSPNTDGGSFDYVIVDFNTTDQETINTVRTAYRVVDKKMYDEDGNVIGTWDTSKLEVGGIFDEENELLDGVYCNIDISTGEERGIILTEFDSDLSSLRNGSGMFAACGNLTTFTSDLSSLTDCIGMFVACGNLTTFTSDLSSLLNGISMFNNCYNLTDFTSNLSSLTNGEYMFYECYKLSNFTSDLSSLTDGSSMFNNCYNLTDFTSDLSSLTNGSYMFYECYKLTTFTSDLSSLTDGGDMFWYCSNLSQFNSDLSSLTNGEGMFRYCKLDAPSVKNIIETINTYSGTLTLGIGCNNTTEDKDLFAQEVGYSDMTSLLAALQAKGWTVEVQFTGRPTATYTLRRPTEDTLPIYAKLEEVEEHGNYTSEDGSKKYRLNWFHETTGSTEGYTQFNSLEESITHFNVKPIERN